MSAKNPQRSSKKRKYSSSSAAPKVVVNRTRNNGPLPAIYQTTLKRVEGLVTTAATVYHNQIYSANSITDVDVNIAGNQQPIGFDQLTALYGEYRVIKLDWRLTCTNRQNSPLWAFAHQGDISLPIGTSDLSAVASQPHVSDCYIVDAAGGRNLVIKGTVYPWTALGITKEDYMTSDYSKGSAGAGPTNNCYKDFWFLSSDGSTTVSMNSVIELVYTVQFYQTNNDIPES